MAAHPPIKVDLETRTVSVRDGYRQPTKELISISRWQRLDV
jgi:hypothetical protein